MSNEIIAVIIGGLLTLSGVFLTTIFQVVSNLLQRRWSVQDRIKQRNIQVIDQRIDHIEQFLEIMTQDFRSVFHEAEFYLGNDDLKEAERRFSNRQKNKENLDTKVFAKGIALRSLHDKKANEFLDSMINSSEKMNTLYSEIYYLKYVQRNEINVDEFGISMMNEWSQYSSNLANLYNRLDMIRKSVS